MCLASAVTEVIDHEAVHARVCSACRAEAAARRLWADTSTFCGFGAPTFFGTGSSGAFMRNGDSLPGTLRILDVTPHHQQITCAGRGDIEQTRFLRVEERTLQQHVVVPIRRLRHRLGQRALPRARHGVRRRADARRSHRDRAASDRRGNPDCPPDRGCARERAQSRHHPSRTSSRSTSKCAPMGRQGPRLRLGESGHNRDRLIDRRAGEFSHHHDSGDDSCRRRARHRGVHEPGTSQGPGGRSPGRHLGVRLCAVRDADRHAGVCRVRHQRSVRSYATSRSGPRCRRTPRRTCARCCSAVSRRICESGSRTLASRASSSPNRCCPPPSHSRALGGRGYGPRSRPPRSSSRWASPRG